MTTDRGELNERVATSRAVLGHPMHLYPDPADDLSVKEGVHYEVLAYTDWADLFYPTTVVWDLDTDTSDQDEWERCYDDFSDLERSAWLRRRAQRIHSGGKR